MEPETNQQSSGPQLCKSGCGFYGNSSTDGLCSKCHKDTIVRTTQATDNLTPIMASTKTTQIYDKPSKEPLGTEQLNQVLSMLNSSKSSLTGNNNNHMIDYSLKSSSGFVNSQDTIKSTIAKSSSNEKSSGTQDYKDLDSHINLLLENRLQNKDSEELTTNVSINSLSSYPSSPKTSHHILTPNSPLSDSSSNLSDMTQITSPSSSNPPPTPPNRCFSCRKKIGLSGFPCRCGHNFCSTHRYSDQHNCQVDYKELAQNEIRKNNPVVQAQKIQKI